MAMEHPHLYDSFHQMNDPFASRAQTVNFKPGVDSGIKRRLMMTAGPPKIVYPYPQYPDSGHLQGGNFDEFNLQLLKNGAGFVNDTNNTNGTMLVRTPPPSFKVDTDDMFGGLDMDIFAQNSAAMSLDPSRLNVDQQQQQLHHQQQMFPPVMRWNASPQNENVPKMMEHHQQQQQQQQQQPSLSFQASSSIPPPPPPPPQMFIGGNGDFQYDGEYQSYDGAGNDYPLSSQIMYSDSPSPFIQTEQTPPPPSTSSLSKSRLALPLGLRFDLSQHGLIVGDMSNNNNNNNKARTNKRARRMVAKEMTSSSKYIGVSFDKNKGKWKARLMCEGKRYFLGLFEKEIEAARAYDDKVLELRGSCARTNFPGLRTASSSSSSAAEMELLDPKPKGPPRSRRERSPVL
jgi:hypothetical protein